MERQQIQDRINFDDIDRQKIWAKSDGYCAHCGKRIEFGGKATVDHFVPLSKGGVNMDYNMIMLCHDCNQKKGNLIYQPEGYLAYLHKEDLDKLSDYFHHSYVHSFDFLHRHDILASDVLCYQALPADAPSPRKQIRKGKHQASMYASYTITLKRMFAHDKDKLLSFTKDYLDKRNYSYIDAQAFLDIWAEFGTIYYMEQSDGIKLAFGILIGPIDKEHLGLQIFCMSKYNTPKYLQMAEFFLMHIVDDFMNEQNITGIPTIVYILKNDPFKRLYASPCFHALGKRDTNTLEAAYLLSYNLEHFEKSRTERETEYIKINQMLAPFRKETDHLHKYITETVKLPDVAEELEPSVFFLKE